MYEVVDRFVRDLVSPKMAAGVVFLVCSVVLFAPVELLDKLGLSNLPQLFVVVIGLVWLTSGAITIVLLIWHLMGSVKLIIEKRASLKKALDANYSPEMSIRPVSPRFVFSRPTASTHPAA